MSRPVGALRMGHHLDNRAERGLACIARQRIHRAINGIDTCIQPPQEWSRRRRRPCRGCGSGSGMPTSSFNALKRMRLQPWASGRPTMSLRPRICERQRLLKLLGHIDVVLDVVFRAVRIEKVAGVADGALSSTLPLSSTASIATRIFFGPVQRCRRFGRCRCPSLEAACFTKALHHVVGII